MRHLHLINIAGSQSLLTYIISVPEKEFYLHSLEGGEQEGNFEIATLFLYVIFNDNNQL